MADQPVCKHHQTGYCKYKNQCPKYHSSNLCIENVCKDKSCKDRHPKTCKYFASNNICKRREWCAYTHSVHENQSHNQKLENEVKHLKEDAESLMNHIKQMNQYHQKEIHEIKENYFHLSNNMSEMMAKVMAIELECTKNHDDEHDIEQDTNQDTELMRTENQQ